MEVLLKKIEIDVNPTEAKSDKTESFKFYPPN